MLPQNYQQTKDGRYVSWKALASGQADEVSAISEGNGNLTKATFKTTPDNQPLIPNAQVLTLTGKPHGTIDELLAYYPNPDTTKDELVAGKLNLVSYEIERKNLVLVSVNKTAVPDIKNLQQRLNEIYSQGVVEWISVQRQDLTVKDMDEANLDDGGSGLLSNYTGDMKKILRAYTKDNTLARDTYYLFLVKNATSRTKLGYMPRSKQAGFIFAEAHQNTDLALTIAHELGHGAFHLRHTFFENNLTQGATDNLMDYPAKSRLDKWQWDKIHNPERVLGLFEGDEEGAMKSGAELAGFYNEAAPLLQGEDFEKKIKAIREFFKDCNNENWESYNGKGIVPYCFWRDKQVGENLYYSNADLPFTSGLIDGGYGEANALYHLPQAIKELSKFPGRLLYAYTLAYWECSPKKLYASWQEYEYVVDQLAAAEKEGGIWTWVKEQWYQYKDKKESLEKYFGECRDAEDLRDDIDQMHDLVSNWKAMLDLSVGALDRLDAYWKTLGNADNIGRYERGKLVVPTVALVLPFGAGVASKSGKIKEMLNALKKASAEDWKNIINKLGATVAKGGGNAFKVITTDIGTALRNRVGHIRKIVFEAKSNGTYRFSGCHSKSAIDELGANARIEITIPKNAEGVYEAKVFAKGPDGKEIVKSGNGGKSTFFPDHWDEAKILEEAEFAVKNNKGLIDPTDATKGYYGFSKDGKVKIGFYYRDTDGYIGSFFPILNP